MSREWCFLVEPKDGATREERTLISLAIQMREPEFDYEQDGRTFRIFGDGSHNPKRVRKAIMHALAESEVADAVVTPLRLGRRDNNDDTYSFEGDDEDEDETTDAAVTLEPVVPFDEIGWAVQVYPRSVFDWTEVRAELQRRRRTILRETDHALEVAARDEADANELIDELSAVAIVRRADAEGLGWFRRWRIRERLLGNYAVTDPTQPRL